MKTVVVESPTKAKTIGRYLGKDYRVIASYGHVRNLVHKDGSVLPDEGFAMKWDIEPRGKKQLAEIKKALGSSEELILATDPDREGEAISWHICEVLGKKLDNVRVSRIAFHEITKSAIQRALAEPSDVNKSLVDAYLARCALDYLVGFKVSPILWRRLPGSRSAGRVQSVALRLVFEREREIENFKPVEYWSISADAKNAAGPVFPVHLISFEGAKLGKFDVPNKERADHILAGISGRKYSVSSVEEKDVKRHPAPPFITSTMQQEAARKLGFTARKTMQLAQKLYEGVEIDGQATGLITYMRTDSTNIASQAIAAMRDFVSSTLGANYIPEKPNFYSKKVRNAQEAHEAIRPTNVDLNPEKLAKILDTDAYKLYSLIWRRAVASQMSSAIMAQTAVDVSDDAGVYTFRATGSTVKFDGFLKLYQESVDDAVDEVNDVLPRVSVGEDIAITKPRSEQHFTQAPPRYTEASLVKKLEELGIGRPSTYANIIYVLQDRKYVSVQKKRFYLEDLGRLVSVFLLRYFTKYVEYGFTAELEQELDDISNEKKDRLDVLNGFWSDFSATVEGAEKLKIKDVIADIESDLSDFIFQEKDGAPDKNCPDCDGTLGLRVGKYGAFVACSNYPTCKYTKKVMKNSESCDAAVADVFEPRVLGQSDVLGGVEVLLKKGPYGFYVEVPGSGKPKRSAVPKFVSVDSVDLGLAEFLLSLPKELGNHPEDGLPVSIGIGRFGPYIKHNAKFTSVKDFDEFVGLDLDSAVNKLLSKKRK